MGLEAKKLLKRQQAILGRWKAGNRVAVVYLGGKGVELHRNVRKQLTPRQIKLVSEEID